MMLEKDTIGKATGSLLKLTVESMNIFRYKKSNN